MLKKSFTIQPTLGGLSLLSSISLCTLGLSPAAMAQSQARPQTPAQVQPQAVAIKLPVIKLVVPRSRLNSCSKCSRLNQPRIKLKLVVVAHNPNLVNRRPNPVNCRLSQLVSKLVSQRSPASRWCPAAAGSNTTPTSSSWSGSIRTSSSWTSSSWTRTVWSRAIRTSSTSSRSSGSVQSSTIGPGTWKSRPNRCSWAKNGTAAANTRASCRRGRSSTTSLGRWWRQSCPAL